MKAYHVTSLTKWSLRAMPAPASKMEEWLSPLKSVETTCRRARERLTRKLTGKLFQDQGEETNAYLVLCVSQDALHGSFSCSLDDLLDVIVFGLLRKEQNAFITQNYICLNLSKMLLS